MVFSVSIKKRRKNRRFLEFSSFLKIMEFGFEHMQRKGLIDQEISRKIIDDIARYEDTVK